MLLDPNPLAAFRAREARQAKNERLASWAFLGAAALGAAVALWFAFSRRG